MTGKVVCNTGPLIALAVVHRVGILRDLFGGVMIPNEVRDELLAGTRGKDDVTTALKAGWLRTMQLAEPLDPMLDDVLDVGEAAVILLARQIRADWVILDERKGRKIAADIYGLHVVGTARLAVEAKRQRLLPNVGEMLSEMRGNGYWISDGIVRIARRLAGEEQ